MDNHIYIILLTLLTVYLIYEISSNTWEFFDNQEKIPLKPENPSQFLANINKAYGDSESNGVFISVIIQPGMDGSGSVLHKDKWTQLFINHPCVFGFIWDTDWLNTGLVDCLFGQDAGTYNFGLSSCIPPSPSPDTPIIDFCELAKDGDNTPDRCSLGLYNLNEFKKTNPDFPNPTSCAQNIIYDLDEIERVEFENNENCFTYIDHKLNNKKFATKFNEGVFLKDIISPIEYQEGIRRLDKLNKPRPSALLFVYNDEDDDYCGNSIDDILKGLKSNFTPDTMVVKARFDTEKQSITNFDYVPTTLGKIPL